MMNTTKRELEILAGLAAKGVDVMEIERRSEREFDLTIRGSKRQIDGKVYGFSAWLVLHKIADLPWTKRYIAEMTDYPQMVMEGDWSGVRDTDNDKLWAIFDLYVVRFLLVGR